MIHGASAIGEGSFLCCVVVFFNSGLGPW